MPTVREEKLLNWDNTASRQRVHHDDDVRRNLDPELQAASSRHFNTCCPLLALTTRAIDATQYLTGCVAHVFASCSRGLEGDRDGQERERAGEDDVLNIVCRSHLNLRKSYYFV